MASLEIDNTEIYARIGAALGISRTQTDWDSVTQADVDRVIRSGRRRFFSAHDWHFLTQHITLLTAAPTDTGTIAIVNGVVTLTGGTWPTNAALSVLVPGTNSNSVEGVFEVDTRDSDTQLTLHDTSVNLDAGTAYDLYQFRYALPTNFGAFLDPITIENTADNLEELREYATLPDYIVKGLGNREEVKTDRPEIFSVTQIVEAETGVPSFYLDIYPLPDAVYVLKTRIRINPGDALAENGDVFHPTFAECMIESILSAAETMFGSPGVHTQRFAELLPEAVRKDKQMRGTRSVRPRDTQGRHRPRNYELIVGRATFADDATS